VHDRYPSEARRSSWEGLREALGDPLFGNPPTLTLLCKDKLRCQHFLEGAGLALPEVEGKPRMFDQRLRDWGTAFLKPRRGSRGDGVRRVRRVSALPPGDWILQRAVPPPGGVAGLALRVLVQRESSGDWWIGPAVARRSADDPVVNAARGAEVVLGSEAVSAACSASVRTQSLQVAAAFAAQPGGDRVVELGLDFVVDSCGLPHLIEANSCPRGRLLYLARQDPERWGAVHQSAIERPLRRLLALAQLRG
jgi:glutathione synthase/RimK-type ligase-like ATP-grasp enzyme